MVPKNPLDAVLSEVLGDDGGLLLSGIWDADDSKAEVADVSRPSEALLRGVPGR